MMANISGRTLPDININIDSNQISRVKSTKILGIIFDERFVFKEHIISLTEKIDRKLNFFRRLRHYLSEVAINLLYKTLIQPLFDYGIALFGYTFKDHYSVLEKLQKKAAKIITFTEFTHQDLNSLYKRLKWMSFDLRKRYFSSIFIYRCINSMSPSLCRPTFKLKDSALRTRSVSNGELVLPNFKKEICRKSVFYSGVNDFNNIDINIRKIQNFKPFVTKLKHFFNQI
jgi:hypothetical protein